MDGDAWQWVWLAAAVGGVVGEIASAGTFFLLPFAIGAAIACVIAFAGLALGLQWLAFIVVSAAAFAAARPVAQRLQQRQVPAGVGAGRWVGQTGMVIQEISAGAETGLVRIGGEEWRAQSRDHLRLPVGAQVLVVEVTGTRLVVLPLELPEGDL